MTFWSWYGALPQLHSHLSLSSHELLLYILVCVVLRHFGCISNSPTPFRFTVMAHREALNFSWSFFNILAVSWCKAHRALILHKVLRYCSHFIGDLKDGTFVDVNVSLCNWSAVKFFNNPFFLLLHFPSAAFSSSSILFILLLSSLSSLILSSFSTGASSSECNVKGSESSFDQLRVCCNQSPSASLTTSCNTVTGLIQALIHFASRSDVHESRYVCSGCPQDTAIAAWRKQWWHCSGRKTTDWLCHYTQTGSLYVRCFEGGSYQWRLGDIILQLGSISCSNWPKDPGGVILFSCAYDRSFVFKLPLLVSRRRFRKWHACPTSMVF